MNIIIPPDHQFFMNNIYYKIGRFGLVFMWLDNGWVKSTKKKSDLVNGHTSPRRDGILNNRGKHIRYGRSNSVPR